jgi:single-strand DNA-binding protein
MGDRGMKNVNSIIIEGRLTKDPEKKAVGQHTLVKCTIANNRDSKDKKIVNFVNIEAWNANGKAFDYLKKGNPVRVIGELKTDTYEKDGHKVYSFGILCHTVEFVSDGKADIKGGGSNAKQEPAHPESSFDDDIPF